MVHWCKYTSRTVSIEGPAYTNFVESLRSDKTKLEYTKQLVEFAEWMGKQLDDLLTIEPKALKQDIIKYIVYLKNDRKLSSSSRGIVVAAIKHFTEMNDVFLPWSQISKFLGQKENANEDREYIHEEISKILGVADLKYQALILLLASSGIRIGAVHSLKCGDLVKVENNDIYKVSVYRKSREAHYTFTTPECYFAIKEYLDYRKRWGEKITAESPLFRNDINERNPEETRVAKALSHDAIKSRLRHLLIKSGVAEYKPLKGKNSTPGKRRNEVKAAHGFRKFCVTQMAKAKVDHEIREMLVGHKLGVKGQYLKYGEQERLNEYLLAVNLLTINEENRLKTKVQKLEKEKDSEIQAIKDEIKSQEAEIKSHQDELNASILEMKSLRESHKELTLQLGNLTASAGVLGPNFPMDEAGTKKLKDKLKKALGYLEQKERKKNKTSKS